MTWEAASAQTRERLVGSRDTYPVVADMIGRALRDAIAESADMNASVTTASESFGVDLSRIVRIANEVIGLVDRDGIEQALAEGICEVVSFDVPAESHDYFEGLAAQPWHIAAGLPAPRPRRCRPSGRGIGSRICCSACRAIGRRQVDPHVGRCLLAQTRSLVSDTAS